MSTMGLDGGNLLTNIVEQASERSFGIDVDPIGADLHHQTNRLAKGRFTIQEWRSDADVTIRGRSMQIGEQGCRDNNRGRYIGSKGPEPLCRPGI